MKNQKNNSTRVEVIDIMRALALMGVLLVHISYEFAGWGSVYTNPNTLHSDQLSFIDKALNYLITIFLVNKSRALLSFLFGVSFFYQLNSFKEGATKLHTWFAKRMGGLLLIGLLHAYLLWSGDILRMYAVCGFFLMLVSKWDIKNILKGGLFFSFLLPTCIGIMQQHFPYSSISDADKLAMYKDYASHSYIDLFKANRLRDAAINLNPYGISSYLSEILGNFMLGFWAIKTNLFHKLASNKKLLYKYMGISLTIGILFSVSFIHLFVSDVLHISESTLPVAYLDALDVLYKVSQQAIGLFNLSAIIYLYHNTTMRYRLQLLIPVGRMSLTNYIMHSVLAVFLFNGVGLGLIGKYRPSVAFTIGIAYFAIQAVYSMWWLKRFTMGPLECVWRSIISGKWQTISRTKLAALTASKQQYSMAISNVENG